MPAKPADEVGSSPSDMHNVKQSAGAKRTIAIVTGRADAKTTISVLNPNRPCGSSGRAMLAPTGEGFKTALSFREWQLTENLRRT